MLGKMVNTSICIGVQAYEAVIFHITDTSTWVASQDEGLTRPPPAASTWPTRATSTAARPSNGQV